VLFKSQPRRCRVTVSGKLFTPISAKLVASPLSIARVTAGLAESNGSLPPGLCDSRHLQADCQEPGSAPEPYARQSSMGYLYLLPQWVWEVCSHTTNIYEVYGPLIKSMTLYTTPEVRDVSQRRQSRQQAT